MIPPRVWRNKIIISGHDLSEHVTAWQINRGDVHAIGSSSAGVDGVVSTVTIDVAIATLPKQVIEDIRAPYAPITIKVYSGDEWQYLLDYDGEKLLDWDEVPFIIEAEEHFLFDGYLGDGDNFVVRPEGRTLQLRGRDQAKRLQASFFDEWSEIPPGRIDTVIQAVLNHMVNPPLLYVPVTPSFSTHQSFRPQNQSVWDVAQQVAIQSGWFLGFELVSGAWRLVLREPPRGKVVPDYQLTGDDVFGFNQGTSDADIRNAVRVLFTDAVTREQSSVYRENTASIAMTAGVRQMSVLPLNSTNQVGTQQEAEALADYFIHDMSDPFANTRVDLPLFPEVQFYDLLELNDVNGVDDQDLAVHTIQHSFSSGAKWRTNVSGTHKVVGRRVSWIDLENRPGAPNDDRSPHQAILPPPLVTLSTENPGFSVTVDERRGVDAVGVEIYWSTSQGFVPSPSTLRGRGDEVQWFYQSTDAGQVQITPGVLHYVRVRSYDSQGNYGEWSPELTIMAKKLASNLIVLDGDVEVTGDIDITRPSVGNTGTLRFWAGNNEVVRIGNIAGKPGVPSGVTTGFWGKFGTGVFIEGAEETIVHKSVSMSMSDTSSVAANSLKVVEERMAVPGAVSFKRESGYEYSVAIYDAYNAAVFPIPAMAVANIHTFRVNNTRDFPLVFDHWDTFSVMGGVGTTINISHLEGEIGVIYGVNSPQTNNIKIRAVLQVRKRLAV